MVTVASLYAELSNLAAQRGVDLRDYALVSFGGAGSLVACRLASELGVDRVIVPVEPGTLCAMGALSADVASNFVRSLVMPLDAAADALVEALVSLEREARNWLKAEAPSLDRYETLLSADMRYVGQSFEVDVPLDPAWVRRKDLAAIAAAFHDVHQRVYAHADPSLPAELVDLRVLVAGAMPKPKLPALPQAERPGRTRPESERRVFIDREARQVPVWRRRSLRAGHRIDGPGLVDQDDTTILLPADWTGTVHESGNLLLRRAS